MHVFSCPWACLRMVACTGTHIGMSGSQKWIWGVFLYHSLPPSVRQHLSLKLELTKLSRLACQWTPKVLLSNLPHPHCWGCRYMSLSGFDVGSGYWDQVLSFAKQALCLGFLLTTHTKPRSGKSPSYALVHNLRLLQDTLIAPYCISWKDIYTALLSVMPLSSLHPLLKELFLACRPSALPTASVAKPAKPSFNYCWAQSSLELHHFTTTTKPPEAYISAEICN